MNREKLLETTLEPPGGFLILAGRTVSIPTGSEELDGLPAGFALIEQGAHSLTTAVDDCVDDLTMGRGDTLAKGLQVLRPVIAKDLTNSRHGRTRS